MPRNIWRVTLDLVLDSEYAGPPYAWDWPEILELGPNEEVIGGQAENLGLADKEKKN